MDDTILEYYRSRRRSGISESNIRLELTQNGWQESDILLAFQEGRKELDRERTSRYLYFFARLPKWATFIISAVFVLGSATLFVTRSTWWQDAAMLGFIFVGIVFYAKHMFSRDMHAWATKQGYSFVQQWKTALNERLHKNPGKTFFGARNTVGFFPAAFVRGTYRERKLWVYAYLGHLPYTRSNVPRTETFVGVCVEMETGALPLPVAVLKKFVSSKDKLTTESRDFEKKYNVITDDHRETLQLLDAHMMDIIMRHNVSAIEFSDASVALFTIAYPVLPDRLDALVSAAHAMAEQVDRNYPLGKYAQKAN